MKKILLFAAAALVAASASAAEVVLAETNFATADGYYFWKSDATNVELKDGGLTITNDAAADNFWDVQYMVIDGVELTAGTEYTVNVKIKGFSGTLHYNFGTWGSNVNGGTEVGVANDWQTVTFNVVPEADTDNTAHLLLQSGDFVGSYTIAEVKVTYDDGQGSEEPVVPEVVIAENDFATADGYYYWKSDATNAELKDGGLTITNDAAADNFWDVQYMVIDGVQLTAGTEYYVDVKIKGFSGILHYNLGTWGSNINGGAEVEAASDWQTVTFKAVPEADTDNTAHLLLQSGDFVGAYTIANVKLYTLGDAAVETIAPVKVNTAVYNLQGVKVANSLDEVAAPGLYISNGKKIIKK